MCDDPQRSNRPQLLRAWPLGVLSACLLSACSSYPDDYDSYSQPYYQGAEAVQPQAVAPTSQQLDQLVAPIALYPDPLVAQILAAATYPAQIVEAERWTQQNTSLKGDELAKAVDTQTWDPSVKALIQVPDVLAMMDRNLPWTSSLGEAYMDNAQAVMDAVQQLRQRAQAAGNLRSTPQQSVTAGTDHRDPAGQSRAGVCAGVRSLARLR